jgi:hypothetical protein
VRSLRRLRQRCSRSMWLSRKPCRTQREAIRYLTVLLPSRWSSYLREMDLRLLSLQYSWNSRMLIFWMCYPKHLRSDLCYITSTLHIRYPTTSPISVLCRTHLCALQQLPNILISLYIYSYTFFVSHLCNVQNALFRVLHIHEWGIASTVPLTTV